MPPRDPELPEGTDHIINGAMETGAGAGASSGGAARSGGQGFIGGAAGDGTGGTASSESEGGTMARQFTDGAADLKRQAADRLRQFADEGKTRASDALDELSRAVGEAADSINEHLGEQYGDYARRTADAVSGFVTNLREREVDDLYREAENFVRKSPVVAIGVAAAFGFALVRLVKAGLPEPDEGAGAGRAPEVATRPGTGA